VVEGRDENSESPLFLVFGSAVFPSSFWVRSAEGKRERQRVLSIFFSSLSFLSFSPPPSYFIFRSFAFLIFPLELK